VWLFVRLVVGIEWARGGLEKIGEPGWTVAPVGKAVGGFLNGAIAKSTQGRYPEVPHWFHTLAQDVFLPNAALLAYLVAFGELLVGIGLIVGGLTRIAALFGVAMNLMFLWSGTSATNPPMLLLGLAIVLIGTDAGAYGIDRWLLPWLRVLWGPRLQRAGEIAVVGAGLLAAAWLALIASNTSTWLLAAAISAAALLIARTRTRAPRGTP
jgi:thiosulfate dehydrogenase [quinone] large subunit